MVSMFAGLPRARAADGLSGPIDAQVERVVDGDTVKVSARIWVDQFVTVSVRLRGADAPELFRPRCEKERALARDAKTFVEGMLSGEDVTLSAITRDKYGGRVVARVETAAGEDVGAALIEEGFAVADGAADPWCG